MIELRPRVRCLPFFGTRCSTMQNFAYWGTVALITVSTSYCCRLSHIFTYYRRQLVTSLSKLRTWA